jgi:hypothetical protein
MQSRLSIFAQLYHQILPAQPVPQRTSLSTDVARQRVDSGFRAQIGRAHITGQPSDNRVQHCIGM